MMATTFKIRDGDVVLNPANGRAVLIGNIISGEDKAKAREKTVQDIKRSLTLSRLPNGDSAAIEELVGKVGDVGLISIQLLTNRRIRSMVNNLIRLQNKRFGIRPLSEQINSIGFLQTFQDPSDPTKFKFRLDVRTRTEEIALSGTVG